MVRGTAGADDGVMGRSGQSGGSRRGGWEAATQLLKTHFAVAAVVAAPRELMEPPIGLVSLGRVLGLSLVVREDERTACREIETEQELCARKWEPRRG